MAGRVNNMNDCVFCGIVSGAIPCMKVCEDERTLAFMDAARDVDGHILVIPKRHCRSMLDCEPDLLSAVAQTVQRVSRHLTGACGYEGVNLLHASEACAGQSVPHFHIHIIPRKRGDGIDAWPRFEGAKEDVRTVYERVRMSGEG